MKTSLQYRALFSVLFHYNNDNKLLVTKYKIYLVTNNLLSLL